MPYAIAKTDTKTHTIVVNTGQLKALAEPMQLRKTSV